MNLKILEGQWYINLTTFPMWLKGDKTAPSLNYKVQTKRSIKGLSDTVIYTKNGQQKTIEGFDTPKENNSFVWRGKGILSLLTSKWRIAHHDTINNWMIIVFEKTRINFFIKNRKKFFILIIKFYFF